jgi:flagellar protein FliO/FliZ
MDHFAASLLSTLVALALVLVLAWAALAALRRIGWPGLRGARAQPDALEFVRALPVGPRERVVVLRYRGEELLLGVTAGGISVLARGSRTPDELPPAAPPA